MATGLTKAIIVLVCINIVLYTSGFRVLPSSSYQDDTNQVMSRFVQDSNGNWIPTQDLQDKLPNNNNPLLVTLTGFVDGLGTVGKLITFIINIVFTPLAIFTSMGLPADAVLIIGMPLMIMLLLGIAYFLRSGF